MASCGFVTISDHNYFPGVRALINSIRANSPAPVTVIDEGLTSAQRLWLAAANVDVRRVERSIAVNDPRFGCCYALFDIDAAPYEHIVCIDPDALVLQDVRSLFRLLDEAPVAAATSNQSRMLQDPGYRRKLRRAFPGNRIRFLASHPRHLRNLFPGPRFALNSGVVAIRRNLLPRIRGAARKYAAFFTRFKLPDQDLLSLCLADIGADCRPLPFEMNATTLHALPESALAGKSLARKYRWVSENIDIVAGESALWIRNRDGSHCGEFHLAVRILHYAAPDKPWRPDALLRPGMRELWQYYHDLPENVRGTEPGGAEALQAVS